LLKDQPRHAEAFLLLGDAKDARHDWPSAETAYRAALVSDPGVPRGHYSLGRILFKQRRYDEAAAALDRELATDPSYSPALRYRAELELDRGQAAAAEAFLERLITTAPEDPQGWRLFGRTRLDQNKPAEAVALLERATKLAPADPAVHYLFGRALSEAGRADEAARAFALATELNQRVRDALASRVSGTIRK
jgi:predicted Zn-dependent protease